jgi:hypothetical protein
MAYASQSGRARVSSTNPRAFGICDRCGFLYNHSDLQWQFDWAGASLINKKILVCDTCLDVPQEQLRAIILPADPEPIVNPRVENYADAETDYVTTSNGTVTDPTTGIPIPSTTVITTEDGNPLTMQPYGPPVGLVQPAVVPQLGNKAYNVKLPVTSVTANGTTVITVTCSKVHNLTTDDQISVEGLTNSKACGFYSVTVTTATAFTYTVNSAINSGSLLTGTTNIVTTIVGLPYGYTQIPLVGP